MKWGWDSNIFIYLDQVIGELKRYKDDVLIKILEFCEKNGGFSSVNCIKKQIENTQTYKLLEEIGYLEDVALDEYYTDEILIQELEELLNKIKSINKHHPDFKKYRYIKQYLSHFSSPKYDLYDICFYLAHRDGKINASLVSDKKLFILLRTFNFKVVFCKNKDKKNVDAFLKSCEKDFL